MLILVVYNYMMNLAICMCSFLNPTLHMSIFLLVYL